MSIKEEIIKKLSKFPSQWADKVANLLCQSICKDKPDCSNFTECETLTILSDFEVVSDGTTICISYIDEKTVTVKRCFDFKDIINFSLDTLDPNCLTSKLEWINLSYKDKWQLIVDSLCDCCNPTTTTTTTSSTTTTTTVATTTTTTTTVAPTTTTTTTLASTTTTTTIVPTTTTTTTLAPTTTTTSSTTTTTTICADCTSLDVSSIDIT